MALDVVTMFLCPGSHATIRVPSLIFESIIAVFEKKPFCFYFEIVNHIRK